MRRRAFVAAAVAATCGLCLIAVAHSLPNASGGTSSTIPAKSSASRKTTDGFLAFTRTPRRPGNLLERLGVVGRSAAGRPIGLRQLGDPSIAGRVLIVGCIHGDECAGSEIVPTRDGCPDPRSNVFVVHNLNPDGAALGTRLNGRGVDLNRNFPSQWRPIGRRGDAQYSGPRPFSEPESRLAARLIEGLAPDVTIWLPPGQLAPGLHSRLDDAIIKVARRQAQVGED